MSGEPSYNDLVSKIQIGEGTAFTHALRASAIPYGQVDSTSTATAFTATVPGINTLKDGVCVLLKNGVVTSASGFTINVNGLGAKPCYTNLAAATRDTTIFNINYTMLFIFDADRVGGGCWICYRGYDSNTNTIGYQIRSNNSTLHAADKGYRYRLWFTSADGSKWVPANKSTSTDATTSRTPNTTPINPFGPIVYNSTNGTVNADASLPAATLWQQYTLNIGYSFNEPGGSMTFPAPVYLKCTPQTDGSAVMVELTQALPSTDDGFIYILLGRAYSATAMELIIEHPVFYNDGTGIRAWTGKKPFSGSYADLTNKPSIPTKTSDLTNDSSFITAAQAPVQSVNTQTGAVVLDADDIAYDTTYSVKGKIDTIVASGGEPNVIEIVKVNGAALTVTNKAVDVPVPVQVESNTTGISIANHSTASIYGVSSSTTSVTGVQADTATASKVTLGTNISVPNVTSAGSASNWVFENITVPIKNANATSIPNVTAAGSGSFTQGSFSGGSFTQGEDTFTPNTPTVINTTKFNGGSFTQGTDSFTANTPTAINTSKFSGGSFTRGTFSGGSFTQGTDSFTANVPTKVDTSKFNAGSFTRGSFSGGSGTFTTTVNNHVLEFSHTHTAATHANDSYTAPSLGTGFYTAGSAASFTQGTDSFTAATHANDSFTPASLANGFYTAGTAASFTQGTDTFTAATHANDSFTANTPTVIDVTKFSGGSFTQGSFNGGSFTQGADSHTAASLGTGFYTAGTAASFTQGEDEFTPATHGTDSHTHTPPTLGTAISIIGVQSTTTTASHVKSGGNGTAPTLGTAISIPNVTGVSNVTVPIKAESATTVPIKNGTATTVVTSATHSITDNGHNHELSYTSNPI